MAAPSTYITIIKQFTYRANTSEEWSNSYAFSGSTPADPTAWRALFDALVTEEKKLYRAVTKVVGGYGYNKIPEKGDHAIWAVDLTISPNVVVPGTLTTTGGLMAGDQAAWVRWGLDRFTDSGKRVYLRKYFHGGSIDPLAFDALDSSYKTALTNFGGKMRDGTFAGARVLVDKSGNTPIGSGVSEYVTTRSLKRRGKRPPTSA